MTNLKGRLRNTNLSKSQALFPFFEAVINSIHAIEDRDNFQIANGNIEIIIKRYPIQSSLTFTESSNIQQREQIPDICEFIIKDNGIGFTDENMLSFNTLDSDYKVNRGCKGIGRLLWLKVYDSVIIESVYEENKKLLRRNFSFTANDSVNPPDPKPIEVSNVTFPITTVRLCNVIKKYQSNISKNIDTLAKNLLEHCLWYFIREKGHPKITICDALNKIDLDDIYSSYILNRVDKYEFTLNNFRFDLSFVRARNACGMGHTIFYCAAQRIADKRDITNKISGLYKNISDNDGAFTFLCFVNSEFLDLHIRPERTGFDIGEIRPVTESLDLDQLNLLKDESIFFEDINKEIYKIISQDLKDELSENIKRGRERIQDYVHHVAPAYKSIVDISPNINTDPASSDKDVDILLHKHKIKLESELKADGHIISKLIDDETFDEYKERLKKYLSMSCALKMSDLAAYVSHRKVIIDFFEQALKKLKNGKYQKEDIIHNLIIPMRIDSNDLQILDANLWLFDERLAFYNYIASDKTIKSLEPINSCVTKEPDIVALNGFDNPILINNNNELPLNSITVIELKRPMRNDYKEGEKDNPIEQVLQYVEKIRDGSAETFEGRPIPKSRYTPAFCYILADLTPTLVNRAKNANLHLTFDNLGFFGYNQNYNAYIEIISYDRFLRSAKERNSSFFSKLGLPNS